MTVAVARMLAALPALLSSCALLLLAGCGGTKAATTTAATKRWLHHAWRALGHPATETKPTAPLDPAKTYKVTLETNCGSFTITLDQAQSPNATASFVYARAARASTTRRSSTASCRAS